MNLVKGSIIIDLENLPKSNSYIVDLGDIINNFKWVFFYLMLNIQYEYLFLCTKLNQCVINLILWLFFWIWILFMFMNYSIFFYFKWAELNMNTKKKYKKKIWKL